MPRVAVVVPCFDDGETLPDALASLAEQEPHELVVVDDGSTDPATLETLADVERRGVRVVRRANGGLSAARMTGGAEAGCSRAASRDTASSTPSCAVAIHASSRAADGTGSGRAPR